MKSQKMFILIFLFKAQFLKINILFYIMKQKYYTNTSQRNQNFLNEIRSLVKILCGTISYFDTDFFALVYIVLNHCLISLFRLRPQDLNVSLCSFHKITSTLLKNMYQIFKDSLTWNNFISH